MSERPRLTLRQIDASTDQPSKIYILSTTTNAKGLTSSRLDQLTSPSRPNLTLKSSQPHSHSEPQTQAQLPVPTFLIIHLTNILAYLKLLFLPTGYPHSVTPDYTPYQIYDSIQAFASTIASLLSSRAVLQSLNVISSASEKSDITNTSLPITSTEAATAATLLSILQSTLSNLTTILFASYAAPRISPDVKFYRFLADVVNDAAFVLDLLAPSLPPSFTDLAPAWTSSFPFPIPMFGLPFRLPLPITPRVLILCTSSALRATCGVAGGSSKAVLSSHFARSNPESVGELNAKDGSQETIINLLGMWVGGVVVSRVEGVVATWCWMLGLLGVHLWANYCAVRSVRLRGLNRRRTGLVVSEVVAGTVGWEDRVGFVKIGGREGVLGVSVLIAGVLGRDRAGQEWRKWRLGVSVEEFVCAVSASTGVSKKRTGALTMNGDADGFATLLHAFRDEKYLSWLNLETGTVTIALKRGALPRDQLKAIIHASMVLWQLRRTGKTEDSADVTASLVESRPQINERWAAICETLERAGWDLESINLEDGTGKRLEIEEEGVN